MVYALLLFMCDFKLCKEDVFNGTDLFRVVLSQVLQVGNKDISEVLNAQPNLSFGPAPIILLRLMELFV